MKLEIEIDDELRKRIDFSAKLLHKSPETYLRELLEERVLRIPDPVGAAKRIAELRAAAGPEDDYDMDEFLETLESNRHVGLSSFVPKNGEPAR
jgi:predicted DNA-binding protein